MAGGWKSILGQVAPTIAQALGGPLAGGVVKKLAGALLGKEDASEAEVEKAVLAADPSMFLKLKEMETEYAKFIADNGIQLEKLAVEDRASARNREIAVKDWVPATLALVINAAFFLLLFLMFRNSIPESNRDAFNILLGMLSGGVSTVLTYYFGSSAGSARKNDLLEKKAS